MRIISFRHLSWALVSFAIVAGLPPAAPASVILVQNLDQSHGNPVSDVSVNATVWEGSAFTTGSSAVSLFSIAINYDSLAAGFLPVASLYAADLSGNITGSPLVSLTMATDSVSLATFTPASGLTLDPDTTYWFVLQGGDSNALDWSWTGSSSFSGTGSIPNNPAIATNTNAAGWQYGAISVGPNLFQVNVTAVPESAAAPVAVALGAILFTLGYRRRKLSRV